MIVKKAFEQIKEIEAVKLTTEYEGHLKMREPSGTVEAEGQIKKIEAIGVAVACHKTSTE